LAENDTIVIFFLIIFCLLFIIVASLIIAITSTLVDIKRTKKRMAKVQMMDVMVKLDLVDRYFFFWDS